MDDYSHKHSSQDVHDQSADEGGENSAPAGFPSFEGCPDNLKLASWDINRISTPPRQPNDEGQAAFHDAFDIGAWETLPSTRVATEFLSHPAPLTPQGPLAIPQGACVPVGPLINFDALSYASMQMLQVQVPYTGNVDPKYDFGDAVIPALELQERVPNTVIDSVGLNGGVGGSTNTPDPMMVVNPRGACANPLFYHGSAAAQGGWMNASGLPPQPYEGDIRRLYDRLIGEGADVGAAMVLRYIIFEYGVTVEALMAAIETPEMVRASGGATKMWELLLETKEMIPGDKKYRCLLCPLENRFEYRHNRDAVRHFNKDHFGFSFPCEHW